jgi:hypothetical protein
MALRLGSDRRSRSREAAYHSRRRYPRLFLDVDWFVESMGCSTLGRGLELSVRGARLPVTCVGTFSEQVTLYVALPGRAKMFKAKGHALPKSERGWVIRFSDVGHEDLQLLARALLDEYGLIALPNLERKFARYTELEPAALRG